MRKKTQQVVADHKCELCGHVREKDIQALYNEWCEPERIASMFSISLGDLTSHSIFHKWDIERTKDTTSFYRAIIRAAGEHFLRNPSQLRSETVAATAKQLDKIEGREQQARKNDTDVARDQANIERKIKAAIENGVAPETVTAIYTQIFPEFSELVKNAAENGRKSNKSRGIIH